MDIFCVIIKELKNCNRISCHRHFGWCMWNKCLVGLLHYCVLELNSISYNSDNMGQVREGNWFIFFCFSSQKNNKNSLQPSLLNNLDEESSLCFRSLKAMLVCFSSKIFIFLSERRITISLVKHKPVSRQGILLKLNMNSYNQAKWFGNTRVCFVFSAATMPFYILTFYIFIFYVYIFLS